MARFTFSLGGVLGIAVVAAACLYGAAYNRHADVLPIVLKVFLPLSALWAVLCYGAYKGLTGRNAALGFAFWLFVLLTVFTFPVGTAIAGVAVWLWRESRHDGGQIT